MLALSHLVLRSRRLAVTAFVVLIFGPVWIAGTAGTGPLAGLGPAIVVTLTVLGLLLAARGESPPAFDRRCIPPGYVASRSNTAGMLPRRALPTGRITALGATADFHHGLLGAGLLPLVVLVVVSNRVVTFPLTVDRSVWFFLDSMLTLGALLALTLWAFYHLAGWPPHVW